MSILRGTSMTTPDASPAHLYADNVVSILPGKRLNNGQPSLYYRLFADAQVQAGAHVVHVGAGTGYYSAILAHLTGPAGRLTAIEYEAELAARARTNLQPLPQVEVIHGDASRCRSCPRISSWSVPAPHGWWITGWMASRRMACWCCP